VLPDGKGERWNGVWEKVAVSDTVFINQPRHEARANLHHDEEVFGLRPWVLNAFVPQTATTTSGGTTTVEHEDLPAGQVPTTLRRDGQRARAVPVDRL